MLNEKFYKSILESSDSELEYVVSKRFKLLNEKDVKDTHYHNEINCIEDNFIPDSLEIFVNDLSFDTYSLKGIDYLDFCKKLKNKVNFDSDDCLASLIIETMNYVRNYFNMDFTDNENDIRDLLLKNDIKKNSHGRNNYISSISIFKGNGSGRCLEHALMLQNLLSFIGIDISFFSTVQKTNNNIVGHCFNVIHANGKNILIDLVNVNILENKKIAPVLQKISDEDYEKLRSGEVFEIERIDTTKEGGKKFSQYILLNAYNRGKKFLDENVTMKK